MTPPGVPLRPAHPGAEGPQDLHAGETFPLPRPRAADRWYLRTKQIATHWEEVLKLATSVKAGPVSAYLIIGKLAAYPRTKVLAWSLKELGKIERSLFYLEWLKSPGLRRRATADLNKGEARNALARVVFFKRLGEMRDRSHED